MQPSHFHRIVSLRIRILIDRAEDLAVMDQLPNVLWVVADDELDLVASVAQRKVDGGARLGSLHNDGVKLSLRESTEKILNGGERFRCVEIVVYAGHLFVLRILCAKLIPALGAEDLRRCAGDAHDIGDLSFLPPNA